MIEAIETAILEALKTDAQVTGSALEKIQIERCPEDASTRLMDSSTGSVWVHFAGIKTSDPKQVFSVVQNDILYYDLDIIMRNLRATRYAVVTDVGAYDVIDRVRQVITGLIPVKAAKPIYMTNCELTEAGRGFWYYTARYAVEIPYMESVKKTPQAWGIAKKITFQDGRTVIVETTEEENNEHLG